MLRSLPGWRNALSAALLLIFSTIPPVQGATADEALTCDAYAAAAVAQSQENAMMKCGFTGNRWSNEFAEHTEWCRSVGPGEVSSETRVRRYLLERCAAKPGEEQQACQSYAEEAVSQHRANVIQGCGFDGNSWDDSFITHFNWCLNAEPAARETLTTQRSENLAQCLRQARAN